MEKPTKQRGRDEDKQGGRVHAFTTKLNIYECEALAKIKADMEAELRKKGRTTNLSASEFVRLRLLNGGEPANVLYPPPPVDNRREKRTQKPKAQTATSGA